MCPSRRRFPLIQWHVCHSKLSHVVGSPQGFTPVLCAAGVPDLEFISVREPAATFPPAPFESQPDCFLRRADRAAPARSCGLIFLDTEFYRTLSHVLEHVFQWRRFALNQRQPQVSKTAFRFLSRNFVIFSAFSALTPPSSRAERKCLRNRSKCASFRP